MKCIQNNNTRYVNLAQLAMKSCAIQIFHISFRFTLILICTNKKQQKLHSKGCATIVFQSIKTQSLKDVCVTFL